MMEVSNSQPQSHTARNFCIAAGAGAGINAVAGYASQRVLLGSETMQKATKDEFQRLSDKTKLDWFERRNFEGVKNSMEIIKGGKVNYGLLAKGTAMGAASLGVIYLVAHGIKSLFKSKEEE